MRPLVGASGNASWLAVPPFIHSGTTDGSIAAPNILRQPRHAPKRAAAGASAPVHRPTSHSGGLFSHRAVRRRVAAPTMATAGGDKKPVALPASNE